MGYQRLALKRVHLDAAPQARAGITGSSWKQWTDSRKFNKAKAIPHHSTIGSIKTFLFLLPVCRILWKPPAKSLSAVSLLRWESGERPHRERGSLVLSLPSPKEGRSPSRSRFQLNRRALGAYSAATAPSRFLERNERWGDSHLLSSFRPSILRTSFDNTSRRT